MQENHSFDNYFGTFPGADGIPRDTCMPLPRPASESRCVRPFRLGGRAIPDFPHDARTHRIQYARGAMDGFVRGASAQRQEPELSVMGFYGSHDLPFHWSAAREYVLFDRFFAAAPGGSVANHLFWLTGTGGGHGAGFRTRALATCRRSSTGSTSAESHGSSTSRTTTQAARSPPREGPTAAHRRYAFRS